MTGFLLFTAIGLIIFGVFRWALRRVRKDKPDEDRLDREW